jgi:hypothetical protein
MNIILIIDSVVEPIFNMYIKEIIWTHMTYTYMYVIIFSRNMKTLVCLFAISSTSDT